MLYKEELTKAMTWLGSKPDTMFLGQTVGCSGSSMFKTFSEVPLDKKMEMPVAEELQMGMSIGLSLTKLVPITVYPRFDFLLLAVNQLVNNLDKFSEMSEGKIKPKVIIRVGIGSTKPLYPGPQHCQNHGYAFMGMLTKVEIIKLISPEDIVFSYEKAYNRTDGLSTILVEYMDFYNEK
jgi:pyruvate/2-oxoglutarate/acetoin dehydrogenase E1 component